MELNYYLSTPDREKSSVVLFVSHNGRRWKKATGVSVPVRSWSKSSQRTSIIESQRRLNLIRAGVLSYLDDYSSNEKVETVLSFISQGEFKERELTREYTPSFMQFYEKWKQGDSPAIRQRQTIYNAFVAMMGKDNEWEDMDMPFYMRLCDRMNERGYSVNYQGSIIKNLKTVLNAGLKYGYHSNTRFQLWKKMHEEAFAVALSPAEMDLLWDATDLTPMEGRIRDLAWVAYLTASRFSDYSRFSEKNIVGDRFTFVPKKTDSPVSIPCSPKIREIFARHNGAVPKVSEQKFNEGLKELCRKVSIDSIVQVPQNKRRIMGWDAERDIYKWELVSSHTFRRSGASALYRAGVPAKVIRFLTGHKSDKTLFLYIKLNEEDGYQTLAGLDFFK